MTHIPHYDVIVTGGGMSGVSAAVSCARTGKSVLLIEQSAMLGGLGTSGLMTMVMASNYWFYGLGKRLLDDMCAQGTARKIEDYPIRDQQRIPFDAESMKRNLDALVLDAGVELLLYTKVIGVEKRDGRITRLHLAGAEGNFEVAGDVLIDATGDAALCVLAGEPFALGDENGCTQAPTMAAYYAGVDYARYEAFLKQYENGAAIPKVNMFHDLIPKAVRDGVLSEADLHCPGIFRISPAYDVGVMNAGHVYGADCMTSKGLTAATVKGRKMAAEYLAFFRRYVPGFEHAYMTNTGSTLGLRETRRLVGQYVTTFEDKAEYKKFADVIMRFDGGAISDVHPASADKEAYDRYFSLYYNWQERKSDDWATLPYRSLLAQNTDNLLVAGRCVSTDRKVQGQIRVMGYCFMMGQAAGYAASLTAQAHTAAAGIDVAQLQRMLKADGIETV